VVELVDQLVTDDLADLDIQLGRHRLLLGYDQDQPVTEPAYGANQAAGLRLDDLPAYLNQLLRRLPDTPAVGGLPGKQTGCLRWSTA
jgi:hypothetical protein